MAKRIVRQSECENSALICKLFQEVFAKLSENDEYNETVDEHNRKLDEVKEDA